MAKPTKLYELNGPMYFDGYTFFNTGHYLFEQDTDWTLLIEFNAVREYHDYPRYVWSCNTPNSSYGVGYPIVKFDHKIDINNTISQLTDCPGGTTVNYRRVVIRRRGDRIKVFVNFIEDHCYVFRQSREFKYSYQYSHMPIILGARVINDVPQNYFKGIIHTFVIFDGEVDDDTCIDYVDREIDVPEYGIPEPEPEPEPEPVVVPCSSLSFTRSNINIFVNEYADLHDYLVVKPDDCTDPIIWESDTELLYHENGFIQGLHEGSAIIRARCGNLTATILVNIFAIQDDSGSNEKPCTSITFVQDIVNLFVGEFVDLNQFLRIRPDGCTDPVIWDADENLLQNVNGLMKGLDEGATKVKATCGDLSDTINVVIRSKEGDDGSDPNTKPCTSITFTQNSLDITVGYSVDLNKFLKVKPEDCTDPVLWVIDEDLLSNNNGVVTGLIEGATKVRAMCGDLSASMKINIIDADNGESDNHPCTSITFSQDAVDIMVGEYIDLNDYLRVRPSDCTDEVIWDADEELLGNSKGFMKGLAEGSTKVRATCGDLYAYIKVNIHDNESTAPDTSKPCSSIAFTQDVIDILVNETFNLNQLLVIRPVDCTDEVIWDVDADLLSNNKGIIKGLIHGSTKVRVVCGDLYATIKVNINSIEEPEPEIEKPCTSISFTRDEVSLYVNEYIDLNDYLQIRPSNCTDPVTWIVDNELLENNNGFIKGLEEGSTIVRVRCGNLSSTIRVVIKDTMIQPPDIGGDIVIDPNPNYEKAISYLERVKLDDGTYAIKLPITSANEVIYNLETGETIHQIFNDAIRAVQAESYTLLEDFATLVGKIAGLIDDNINAHHIYRDNMKTNELITVLSGRFAPGSVSNGTENKLSFHMKNPIVLKDKPIKFQLKDIKNVVGDFNINIKITFNALDDEPLWIDYTEYYKQGRFIPLTVDYASRKQQGVDWAINFIFEAERVTDIGTIEVVDFMVLHL